MPPEVVRKDYLSDVIHTQIVEGVSMPEMWRDFETGPTKPSGTVSKHRYSGHPSALSSPVFTGALFASNTSQVGLCSGVSVSDTKALGGMATYGIIHLCQPKGTTEPCQTDETHALGPKTNTPPTLETVGAYAH